MFTASGVGTDGAECTAGELTRGAGTLEGMRTIEPPAPTPESVLRRTEHAKTEKALKSLNRLTGMAFDATLELRTTMAAQLEELAETPAEAKLRLAHEKR